MALDPLPALRRWGKAALIRSPYRSHHLLPTMVPLAPAVVDTFDRCRASRTPVHTMSSLEQAIPPAESEWHAPCPACWHDGVRLRFLTPYGYRAGECAACGLLYRVPAVRPERVPDLYTKGDYSTFLDGDYATHRQDLYRRVLRSFSPLLDDGSGRTLLDFGCGTGLFMEVAAARGFDVHGVDLAPDAVQRAATRFGAHRVAGDPSELGPGTPDRFDVITMWSVLAHVAEPRDQIQELHDLLGPGGQLLIYTVNARSLERRAFGSRWNGFTRNHLIFWDEANLRRLLGEIGFSRVEHRPFQAIERDDPAWSTRLVDRHRRAVERWNGGNMLHVVATK